MEMMAALVVITCVISFVPAVQHQLSVGVAERDVGVVGALLEALPPQPYHSFLLLTDGAASTEAALQEVRALPTPCGVAVFEASATGNESQTSLTQAVVQARRVRLESKYVTVLVVSDDLGFVADLAEELVLGRLLVWDTQLLLLSRLPLTQLHHLLSTHWTFTMMKAMFIIPRDTHQVQKRGVYVHLPYSQQGSQLLHLASWSYRQQRLRLLNQPSFFPEKFANFHGAIVNVTALPFAPYWMQIQEEAPDGNLVERLTGTDYLLLTSVADALNFTIYNVPINSWVDVVQRVEERQSFMAPVVHLMLPERTARYDFSYQHEFTALSFTLAKPGLKPQWHNLYYPLAGQVWAASLAMFFVMSASLITASHVSRIDNKLEVGQAILDTLGILMEENLSRRLPGSSSGRMLVAGWLIFSFIIGNVYRGNLTAVLTLPKYPPRPETAEQLVKYVEMVTMPPYGAEIRRFFLSSDSPVFQKLGQMMHFVPTVSDGINQALKKNHATIESRRYLSHIISSTFTRADGTTRLYQGRQSIIPGLSAWPIPHDAPFKPTLNRCMMAVIEAGLYEKWSDDLMNQARLESSRAKREFLAQQKEQGKEVEDAGVSESNIMAISLVHMQGPLLLLLLGVLLASFSFSMELMTAWFT